MDDNTFDPKPNQSLEDQYGERWHQEQRRQQFDIIRVKNPTTVVVKRITYELPSEDFYVKYDTNQFQRIPANSFMDIPRNRADRYVEHMKDKIVNYVNKKLHDDYIAERDKKGLPRFTDKATENKETYETQDYPKSNDAEVIDEIFPQLWFGVVNLAGRDVPPDAQAKPEDNLKTGTQRALDKLKNLRVNEDIKPTEPDFAQLNDQLSATEVTKNE